MKVSFARAVCVPRVPKRSYGAQDIGRNGQKESRDPLITESAHHGRKYQSDSSRDGDSDQHDDLFDVKLVW